MQVRKRTGELVKFDEGKIEKAIKAAFDSVVSVYDESILSRVLDKLKGDDILDVEFIQDTIQDELMTSSYTQTAASFIKYRTERSVVRDAALNLVDDYVEKGSWLVNENSNMSYSLQGLNNHIASDITKKYWLDKIYSKEIASSHYNGDLHIHDLGLLSVYCVGWDLEDLLAVGFKGVEGKIESSPAKHFRSALGQVVNFFYTLQGEASGAQAFSSLDTLLAPFIRYDGLDYKAVKQAMQEFIFNINVPTRVGFQTPFTNVTLDLEPSSNLKDKPVVIGGKMMDTVYGDFQKEIDMFNRAFFEVMSEGDAKGRVFTFPIPTVNLTPDFDWDAHDELWQATAKYGIPSFANFVSSDMSVNDTRSMCPLPGDTKVLVKSSKGIFVRSIKDAYKNQNHNLKKNSKRSIYKVVGSDGRWYDAMVNKQDRTNIVKINLSNGDCVEMGVNHLQPVLDKTSSKTIKAKDIKVGDWIPFNNNKIDNDSNLGDFQLGVSIGAFAGDGSYSKDSITYTVGLKNEELIKDLELYFNSLGFSTRLYQEESIYRLNVNGAKKFMLRYISGTALTKKFSKEVFNLSEDALNGVIKGMVLTDGARDRKRIYSSSIDLIQGFKCVFNLLGRKTLCNYVDTREGRLGENPNYRLDYPERTSYGDLYKENGLNYFRVENVEILENNNRDLYCFEVDNDDHLFTLANGLITHNCRLSLSTKELNKRGGGLFGANPLTGSIGVVTPNLPRLAAKCETIQDFLDGLGSLMDLAKDSLCVKRKFLEKYTDNNLYPYIKFYLRNIKERTGKYWGNHFSTIGLIGLNEACVSLLGCDLGSEDGVEFGKTVLCYMNERLLEYQEETGDLFNLEATPAEGTSRRLAGLDLKAGLDVVFSNQKDFEAGDTPFYSNSSQLPVNYTDDIIELMDLQSPLQEMYTGGTIQHIFLGEAVADTNSVKEFVKMICSNYKLPYFTVTPTFSICKNHGYLSGEQKVCDKCGESTEVYSRVVGYLRPVKQWNDGKQAEFKIRKTFEGRV